MPQPEVAESGGFVGAFTPCSAPTPARRPQPLCPEHCCAPQSAKTKAHVAQANVHELPRAFAPPIREPPPPVHVAPAPAIMPMSLEKQMMQHLITIEQKVDDMAKKVASFTDEQLAAKLRPPTPSPAPSAAPSPKNSAVEFGEHFAAMMSSGKNQKSESSSERPVRVERTNRRFDTNASRMSSQESRCRATLDKLNSWSNPSNPEFRPLSTFSKVFGRVQSTSVTVSVEEASEEESSDSPKRRASHRIGDIIAMTIESERRDDSNEHVDRLRKMWNAPTTQKVLMIDSFMGFVVITNIIVLGISADVTPSWPGWLAIDGIFAALFLAECLLKIALLGMREYFTGPDMAWHIIEVGFTIAAMLEFVWEVTAATENNDAAGSITVFRIIRLVRIGRILRVCKLHMFAELAVMINGTVGGIKTLLSSGVLICLALYAVALAFREGLGNDRGTEAGTGMFNTVGLSFFTVFRCIVGGDCAQEDGRPLFWHVFINHGWGFALLYLASTFFVTFGLFNVIVAIFVENVVAAARTNETLVKRQRSRDKLFFANKMTQLVELISAMQEDRVAEVNSKRLQRSSTARAELFDKAAKIEITPQLFERLRQNQAFADICSDLEVADEDHFNLFETLDVDGSGTIDIEEFVEGISKLRGGARRSDIIQVSFMVQRLLEETTEAFDRVTTMLESRSS